MASLTNEYSHLFSFDLTHAFIGNGCSDVISLLPHDIALPYKIAGQRLSHLERLNLRKPCDPLPYRVLPGCASRGTLCDCY